MVSSDSQSDGSSDVLQFQLRRQKFLATRSPHQILAEFRQSWGLFMAVNFKHNRLPIPPSVSNSNNLCQDAPESICRQHSLHLIASDGSEEWQKLADAFAERGALAVIFTDLSRDDLIKGLKLYLAWYAQPASLRIQLDQGSDHLRRGIMTGVKALLLQTTPNSDWVVYLPPGVSWPSGSLQLNRRV